MPKTLFTKEKAREMQAIGAQTRAINRSTRKAIVKSVDRELEYHEFTNALTLGTQGILLKLVLMLSNAKQGDLIVSLSAATERLFKIWAHLTQTPAPGQLRPEKMRKLMRDHGLRSALDKMLAQPSIVMSEEPGATPNQTPPTPTPESTQTPLANLANTLSLTPNPDPLTTNQNSPLDSQQQGATQPPKTDDMSMTTTEKKESLNSQAAPSPPLAPHPPAKDVTGINDTPSLKIDPVLGVEGREVGEP